jgi:hypothetical protein
VCQTPCITIQKNFSDQRLTYINDDLSKQLAVIIHKTRNLLSHDRLTGNNPTYSGVVGLLEKVLEFAASAFPESGRNWVLGWGKLRQTHSSASLAGVR